MNQPIKIAIQDASGKLQTGDTSTVTLSIQSGPGGFLAGDKLNVAAVNGIATFNNVSFDVAGTYTLVASSNSVGTVRLPNIDIQTAPIGGVIGPVITLSGSTPVTTPQVRTVLIDDAATFTSELPNLNQGILLVSLPSPKSGEAITLPKVGRLRLGARNQVFLDNTVIGTKSGSASKYKIKFNSNATPDAIQELIRSLSFTAAKKPKVSSRTVEFQLVDGRLGIASASKTIQVVS